MVVYEPVLGMQGESPPFCGIALDGVPGTEGESDPIVHWSRGTETYVQRDRPVTQLFNIF